MLEKIKSALRIDDDSLDEEIQDNIDAAKSDLKLSGILESKILETDPLIIRAIKTFCKYELCTDDKEADRYKESYENIKIHLSLSIDYTEEVAP
jgi:uncharacterized phage protein (possible DNA packaging)